MENKRVTVGFEPGIKVEEIKNMVQELKNEGYEVFAPFYIMYELSEIGLRIAKEYMKESIYKSDIFYILSNKEGIETEVLKELKGYAKTTQTLVYNVC